MDVEQIEAMVDAFLEAGLTYFDTAYVYDKGESEKVAKLALVDRYPRDAYTIATKANAWLGEPTEEQVKRQFEVSCQRMGIYYVDYYLLHAIQANNNDTYDSYGLWDWVRGLKEQGLVRHWGFSFHSSPEHLDRLLTQHPDVEFIQLQVNYADWEQSNVWSRGNIEVAQRHGVPYTIMEPIKGGTLATPPAKVRQILDQGSSQVGPDASYASWAVRFAASQPGVITTLSGMSTLDQIVDNCRTFSDPEPLSDRDMDLLMKACDLFHNQLRVPCTACRYCTPDCPMEINIPEFLKVYNDYKVDGMMALNRADAVVSEGKPADCIGCGSCTSHCPQGIAVPEIMPLLAEALSRRPARP